jgi:hypothetical protein
LRGVRSGNPRVFGDLIVIICLTPIRHGVGHLETPQSFIFYKKSFFKSTGNCYF